MSIIASYSISYNEDIKVFSYTSVDALLATKIAYNILFLDIRFNSSETGLDAAKMLRISGNDCIIVLLTSLKTKAIEGYEVGAYHYLVKPIRKETIFRLLRQMLIHLRNKARVIPIKHEYGTEIISISQIQYIQSSMRKRYIHLTAATVETWEPLKDIFAKLPYGEFGYIQKGTVINFEKVSCVMKNSIILEKTTTLNIGRQYKQTFFDHYFAYMGK